MLLSANVGYLTDSKEKGIIMAEFKSVSLVVLYIYFFVCLFLLSIQCCLRIPVYDSYVDNQEFNVIHEEESYVP